MNTTLHSLAARILAVRLFICACFIACISSCASTHELTATQQVVFGPSLASPAMNGSKGWLMRIQGRVFEPSEGSTGRKALIDALAPMLGGNRSEALYRARAGYFVSDSVRNASVSIALGDRVAVLRPTDASGCFASDIPIGGDEAARLVRNGLIAFESLPTAGQASRFRGTALMVPTEGVTVVTDMDDTLKVTNIKDHAEAKANTFVRPFQPVAGMAELYRAWQQASGAPLHFHVVSAGPWQFHEPLRRFTEDAGFPAFTWDMRCIDITNPAVLVEETVKPDPQRVQDFKVTAIRALLARLPLRHVVLVGDSGERDPEVYATIVKEFGARVDAVYIRNVSGEGQDAKRYDDLFGPLEALPKLKVFERPEQLPQQLGGAR